MTAERSPHPQSAQPKPAPPAAPVRLTPAHRALIAISARAEGRSDE